MSFSTTIKIIIGTSIACLLFLIVWAVRNPEGAQKVPQEETLVMPDLDTSLLPEQLVRVILSRGSFNNPETVWLPTQMSEPTPVSEILEVEDAWQSVYLDFQNIFNLDTEQMNLLWEKLTQESSVGEWETVVVEFSSQQNSSSKLMQIQIPFTTNNITEIGPFGCGTYITFQTIEVPQSPAVLNSVYQQLFEISDFPNDDNTEIRNVITSQANLEFDSVTIEDGNASVYLSGTIMGNHCADVDFRKQIEEAAFQFETVDQITVYLNKTVFDWCVLSDADPEESGCDITPKLWITEKEI